MGGTDMTTDDPRKPPILGTSLFVAVAVCAAVVSILIGWIFYANAGKPMSEFYAKLGELFLQLAILVTAGALVKAVVDWGTSLRSHYLEQLDARKEFMRRIRAMHVAIQNARDLMNAHGSARTWGEQSRRLMQLRPEVEEISEDLKISKGLFAKRIEIVEALEKIVAYLDKAGIEYVKSHDSVDSG